MGNGWRSALWWGGMAWAGLCWGAGVPTVSLNDTGVRLCRDWNGVDSACTGYTGQDGESGRDVTANDDADGLAGFSFARMCNSGVLAGSGACPASPVLGPAKTDWGCTRDKRSGLVWEVKVKDGGLRDMSHVYTNYGDGRSGDASALVAAVNTAGLCASKTWRLPTRQELQSLFDYGIPEPGPTVDPAFLPNLFNGAYWTSDSVAGATDTQAWSAGFYGGYVSSAARSSLYRVLLVRGTNLGL